MVIENEYILAIRFYCLNYERSQKTPGFCTIVRLVYPVLTNFFAKKQYVCQVYSLG